MGSKVGSDIFENLINPEDKPLSTTLLQSLQNSRGGFNSFHPCYLGSPRKPCKMGVRGIFCCLFSFCQIFSFDIYWIKMEGLGTVSLLLFIHESNVITNKTGILHIRRFQHFQRKEFAGKKRRIFR